MSGPSDRCRFLRGLVTLPLIGGGVTLIGQPTAAAEPVTKRLLDSYDAWLFYERRYLKAERHPDFWRSEDDLILERWKSDLPGARAGFVDHIPMANGGAAFHFSTDPMKAPQPSTRAAVVLSAVGCDWRRQPGGAP